MARNTIRYNKLALDRQPLARDSSHPLVRDLVAVVKAERGELAAALRQLGQVNVRDLVAVQL